MRSWLRPPGWIALAAVLLLAACGSNNDEHPMQVLTVNAGVYTLTGAWTTCYPTGGSSSRHDSLTFSASGKATFSYLTHSSVADCSTSPDTIESGSVAAVLVGAKSVPWDGLGVPAGVSDPIVASTVWLAFAGKSGSLFSRAAVMVVDDRGSPVLLYYKDDAAGGPIGADGYPDDITQLGGFLKIEF